MKHFGSGWSWLLYNPVSQKLVVLDTLNQDNPLSPVAYKVCMRPWLILR